MLIISEKKDCCGCEACANICPNECIKMISDEEGFKYPSIDYKKCINCNQCVKVCPVLNKESTECDLLECFAAVNPCKEERMQCSSGGVFPILAEAVLQRGGFVIGAAFSDDCYSVNHIVVVDKENVNKLYGSKYVQSNINNIYKQVKVLLNNNDLVLFTGTPCQIESLHNYLKKDYAKLICVDIICHGVPSPELWIKNIKYIEKKKKGKVVAVNFRSKIYGTNSEYGVSFENRSGKLFYNSKQVDPYFQMFLNDYSLRPSCYHCKFKGINRVADITLGDFWGIGEFVNDMDDGYGSSIVVIHTEKGRKLFEQVKQDLSSVEVNAKDVFSLHNLAMIESVKEPEERKMFWEDYKSMRFGQLSKKYVKITFKDSVKEILKKHGILKYIRKIWRGI